MTMELNTENIQLKQSFKSIQTRFRNGINASKVANDSKILANSSRRQIGQKNFTAPEIKHLDFVTRTSGIIKYYLTANYSIIHKYLVKFRKLI